MGDEHFNSHQMKVARRVATSNTEPVIRGDPQPNLGPDVMPSRKTTIAPVESAAPNQSNAPRWALSDRLRAESKRMSAAIIATTAIRMLL